MVSNKHKEQISISLFTGAILAILIFIGTFAGNFLWELQKLYPKYMWISGSFFLIIFFIMAYWFIKIAIKNLTSQTDYHKIGDHFK